MRLPPFLGEGSELEASETALDLPFEKGAEDLDLDDAVDAFDLDDAADALDLADAADALDLAEDELPDELLDELLEEDSSEESELFCGGSRHCCDPCDAGVSSCKISRSTSLTSLETGCKQFEF